MMQVTFQMLGMIPKYLSQFWNSYASCSMLIINISSRAKTDKGSKFSSTKRMKIIALYQILLYNVNNGEKKTPLHLLDAEMIHNTCRSKTSITSFNHYGLRVSYDELVRYHKNMASYILSTSANDIPLPSHFDTNIHSIHSIAAFDNFYHNENTSSGLGSSHDTVSILIQGNQM